MYCDHRLHPPQTTSGIFDQTDKIRCCALSLHAGSLYKVKQQTFSVMHLRRLCLQTGKPSQAHDLKTTWPMHCINWQSTTFGVCGWACVYLHVDGGGGGVYQQQHHEEQRVRSGEDVPAVSQKHHPCTCMQQSTYASTAQGSTRPSWHNEVCWCPQKGASMHAGPYCPNFEILHWLDTHCIAETDQHARPSNSQARHLK